MAAPTLTSPRGQDAKYFYRKDTFGGAGVPSNGYNLPQNGETEDTGDLAGTDDRENVTAGTVTALNADPQGKTDIDEGEGVHNVNLSYNPITDHFKIIEGEYVL